MINIQKINTKVQKGSIFSYSTFAAAKTQVIWHFSLLNL